VSNVSVLKKIMLMGVGAATLTRDKAEEMVEELVKRGEVAAGDRAKAIEEIQQKAQAAAGDLKKMVDDSVEAVAKKVKWIEDLGKVQTEVSRINARLDQIEKLLKEREGQAK
jgi:polyhydroxyalkanoate synthesis regulator phasin